MASTDVRQKADENKFSCWAELPNGGRIYWLEVEGNSGWKVKYVKVVNCDEDPILLYQDIFNERGELVEIHERFPADKGHRRVEVYLK